MSVQAFPQRINKSSAWLGGIILATLIGMSSDALAGGKTRKAKKSSHTPNAPLPANDSSGEAEHEEVVVQKHSLSKRYLALGIGQSLSSTLASDKSLTFASGLASTSSHIDYKLANAPAFSLELWNLMTGTFGFSLGAYYEQPKKLDSFKLEDSEESIRLGSALESEFSQYGGMANLMVAGEIPYAYGGVNYGAAELKFKDSDREAVKYDGAIGWQVGLGVKLGEFISFEGSYRVVNFTKEEDGTFADSSTKIAMVSSMASIKILLH